MPWKSDQQRKWGNSPAGIKAMGADKVREFNEASKGKKMPKKKGKDRVKEWLQSEPR